MEPALNPVFFLYIDVQVQRLVRPTHRLVGVAGVTSQYLTNTRSCLFPGAVLPSLATTELSNLTSSDMMPQAVS